jgi:hypothetical protein
LAINIGRYRGVYISSNIGMSRGDYEAYRQERRRLKNQIYRKVVRRPYRNYYSQEEATLKEVKETGNQASL